MSPSAPIGSFLASFPLSCIELEFAIQGWMGKHLSYVGRLELIRSVLFGIMQFWLSIFPMPDTIINQITCICRNFLWTGNTARSKSVLVAWKHICLPNDEGGLRLYDIKARNLCFIAK
jgi:hypothetical protein